MISNNSAISAHLQKGGLLFFPLVTRTSFFSFFSIFGSSILSDPLDHEKNMFHPVFCKYDCLKYRITHSGGDGAFTLVVE